MKRTIYWGFWIIVFGLLAVQTRCDADQADQLVRIGLAQNVTELKLAIDADMQLWDLSAGEDAPQQLPQLEDQVQMQVTCTQDAILVNNGPVGPGPLKLVPGAALLRWNGRNYRGEFRIVLQNGRMTLINQLPMEDYLRGVVPCEVMPGWPLTALKAQAIAARTYTVANLNRHAATGFDLCDTSHCQVYGGASSEKPTTDQAVLETAGAVLMYKGKVISAFYHDTSGGYTSDAADIWGGNVPYLKAVPDWDSNSPHAQWTRVFNWSELQAVAARSYPQTGTLQQILPVAFGREGRILKLTLKGASGETTITGEQFRNLTGLSSSNIQMAVIYGPEPCITLWWVHGTPYPEALIADPEVPGLIGDVLNPPWDLGDPWEWLRDKEPLKVVLKGAGWGHGVGLSQWGAKSMAEKGYNEQQILEYFYPGAKVIPLPLLGQK